MTLVPFAELFFHSAPLNLAKGAEVKLYERGTQTLAAVYTDEAGEDEATQPLHTDSTGRVGTDDGEAVWVAVGSYDVEFKGERYPWEAAAGDPAAEVESKASKAELEDKAPEVYVADFGAKGEGGDETEVIQKAIYSLPERGGTVFFATGTYGFTTLDLAGRRSIVLAGVGGLSGGATPGTILNCIADEGIGIDARSSGGIVFTDMAIRSDVEGYDGVLVDASHGEAAKPSDTAYLFFERCRIASTHLTATPLDLDKVILSGGDSVVFEGGDYGITGLAEESSYSNGIGFTKTTFAGQGTAAILNPGESWYINGWLEPLASGAANPIRCTTKAKGLTLAGVWTGDDNGEGSWLEFSRSWPRHRGRELAGREPHDRHVLDLHGDLDLRADQHRPCAAEADQRDDACLHRGRHRRRDRN